MQLKDLKTNIDSIMKTLHTGNITNPIEAVEQITYFIFLKLLWENEKTLSEISPNYKKIFVGDSKKISWGSLITLTGNELFNKARESLENLSKLPNMNDTGKMLFRGSTLKIFSPAILRTVIQKIDTMNFSNTDNDPKGDIYEYLISKIKVSGLNGQFRTPRNIIDMMIKLIDPKPGETICDPACGTAGFLVSSYKHILQQNTDKKEIKNNILDGSKLTTEQWKFLEEKTFNGFDSDSTMAKISLMNLYMHGLQKSNLKYHDPLTSNLYKSYASQKYDIIFANPPFTGTVAPENILSDLNYQLNTSSTELLFIKFILDHLNEGGRAAIIVPNGVVFSDDDASIKIRKKILEECNLKMVLQLPYRIFEPYTPTGTNILILEKKGKTKKVFYYEMENDGFSLNKKRDPIKDNDIPDIIKSFKEKKENLHVSKTFFKSFFVESSIIKENNYFLAIGRYKKIFPQLRKLENPDKYNEILIKKTEIYKKNQNKINNILEVMTKINKIKDFKKNKNDLPDNWKIEKLEKYISETSEISDGKNKILSVTKNEGLVLQEDRFSFRIASSNIDKYKLVKPGEFAYDPMLLWSGAIGRNNFNFNGIISPAYISFKVSEEINHEYLLYILNSPQIIFQYKKISFGTNERRRKASFDNFSKIEIPIPPKELSNEFVSLFRNMDEVKREFKEYSELLDNITPSILQKKFGPLLS